MLNKSLETTFTYTPTESDYNVDICKISKTSLKYFATISRFIFHCTAVSSFQAVCDRAAN